LPPPSGGGRNPAQTFASRLEPVFHRSAPGLKPLPIQRKAGWKSAAPAFQGSPPPPEGGGKQRHTVLAVHSAFCVLHFGFGFWLLVPFDDKSPDTPDTPIFPISLQKPRDKSAGSRMYERSLPAQFRRLGLEGPRGKRENRRGWPRERKKAPWMQQEFHLRMPSANVPGAARRSATMCLYSASGPGSGPALIFRRLKVMAFA